MNGKGKIGVFDSGLGGLFVFRSMVKILPEYDYIYLGDTKRVPYGNRSHEAIRKFLEEAVDFLFKEGCELVIVACNTASALALREVQQEYLPTHYPERRVLGVIVPSAEIAQKAKKVGILATQVTVESGTFPRELKKLNPGIEVYQAAAPLLVPMIEENKLQETRPFLEEYLRPLLKKEVDTLILGCTHYGLLRSAIRKMIGPDIRIISQDRLIPLKLKDYLDRHPELEKRLSHKGRRELLVTDLNDRYIKLAGRWFGKETVLRLVDISS